MDENDYEKTSDIDINEKLKVTEMAKLQGLFPDDISDMIIEIQQALQQLHIRHLSECQAMEHVYVRDIGPKTLNARITLAVHEFVSKRTLADACDSYLDGGAGYARTNKEVLWSLLVPMD